MSDYETFMADRIANAATATTGRSLDRPTLRAALAHLLRSAKCPRCGRGSGDFDVEVCLACESHMRAEDEEAK